ncbi:hypothetical protein BRC67_09965 [Halobacteriales archaeon QH_3_68_24]|jgi:DNA-binding transcriptional ArsR family regulator|nr:MAG: hypothetical protein BRC67_09965 [Halobacteriales archaeon QH_3_68_24]
MRVTLMGEYTQLLSMATEERVDGEAYAEDTPIVDLFGDGARARLLSVFVGHRSREFSVSELARQAGVTRKTVYEHIEDFERWGIVRSADAAQGRRYAYAEDSEVAQRLYELDGLMLKQLLDADDE